MSRVSIGEAIEDLEVEIFGESYTARPITKSVVKGCEDLQSAIQGSTEGDELVASVGAFLDYMLPAKPKQAKPSKVLRAKWDADELRLNLLYPLVEAVANPPRPI